MKRRLLVAVTCLSLFLLNACYSIKYVETGEEVQGSKRIIYLFWGAVPMTSNSVKSGQKVEEKFTFVDYLITGFTLGIVSARSVEAN